MGLLGSEQDINPNYFRGTGMAAFIGVEHSFKVVSLFVFKIIAKKAFVTAHIFELERCERRNIECILYQRVIKWAGW